MIYLRRIQKEDNPEIQKITRTPEIQIQQQPCTAATGETIETIRQVANHST